MHLVVQLQTENGHVHFWILSRLEKNKKKLQVPHIEFTFTLRHWPRHRIQCVLRCIIVTLDIKCRSRIVWSPWNKSSAFIFVLFEKKNMYSCDYQLIWVIQLLSFFHLVCFVLNFCWTLCEHHVSDLNDKVFSMLLPYLFFKVLYEKKGKQFDGQKTLINYLFNINIS